MSGRRTPRPEYEVMKGRAMRRFESGRIDIADRFIQIVHEHVHVYVHVYGKPMRKIQDFSCDFLP